MSEVKCPKCGEKIQYGNFCTNCGASLQEASSKIHEATATITSGTASLVDGMSKLAAALGEYTDQKVRSVARRKEISDVLNEVGEAMKNASREIDRVAKEIQDRMEKSSSKKERGK